MPLPQVEALLAAGRIAEGVGELDALAADPAVPAGVLAEVGQFYTHLNRHSEAEACYARAVVLEPESAAHRYNWATALLALGRMGEAEAALDRVIELNPSDGDAYYNRATLRRQTREHNHVAQIEAALAQPIRHPAAAVALNYALAKELEDLGEISRGFEALRRGADLRRRLLSYHVEDDEATMAAIASTFGAQYLGAPPAGYPDLRPIFVVGLPRSGTTLVDRILSSHSEVISRGESNEFARSLMRSAGATTSKAELIARAASADPAAMGAHYCRALGEGAGRRWVDKNPVNFLYLGIIARSLPGARLIHVRRDPRDVCYAMYKTLFRMAYPFSYDLTDLARYFAAYERLMTHWRVLLGDRLLEVQYEDLVANQEPATRRLLDSCGLPWEEACLHFERNEAPCLTASAAQVRQPLYTSSVGRWRAVEPQLAPLLQGLRGAGVQYSELAVPA